jgi:rRNA-processing protein FCF1
LNRPLLILDANVLIDFYQVGIELLGLFVTHLGPVFIPMEVLKEARGLSRDACVAMGATVVEASFKDLTEASSIGRPRLSFEDSLCLVMARSNGWTCVTNDRALRKSCTAAGVPIKWELEAIAEINGVGGLTKEKALEYGFAIQACNHGYLTKEIMARFQASLR